MKYKRFPRALLVLLVLGLTLVPPLWADMSDPSGHRTIRGSDVSPVGGVASVGGSLNLAAGSRPPAHLTRQDYQAIYAEAQPLLARGRQFRLEEISIVPADTITNALKNYSDFNSGEFFYAFCADYDHLEAHGDCPPTDPEYGLPRENIRDGLFRSLELYANLLAAPSHVTMQVQGQSVPVAEIGRRGVLSATREIAHAHLIFGNEFLIDATDYRFSASAVNADLIIGEELDQLEMGLQQFRLATELMVYAFTTPLGGEVRDRTVADHYLGDYFTSQEFELFGVASSRMMTTLGEMAVRYRLLGQEDKALALYDQAYTTQYMQAIALAQQALQADADYLQNGSWEMLNNLSQMRERAQALRDGLDPFGFSADYVPLQSYEHLLELTEGLAGSTGLLATARDLEDQAREAQRTFDANATAMDTELDNLSVAYDDALFDLCGETDDDYETCTGGLMAQNRSALIEANQRVALAWQRAENVVSQIEIEEERAGQVIDVTLGLGQEIAAIELAIGKLESYRLSHSEITSSENQIHTGVEIGRRQYTQVEASVCLDLNPLKLGGGITVKGGVEMYLDANFGYNYSKTWINSSELKWDPNAQVIRGYQGVQALKEAEAQATIEGANSAAVIKNLLLQQSEQLLEVEIALEAFNKAAAEHNHLAQRYSRLLNKRALAVNRVIRHNSHLVNPAYRIMRDTLTVQAAEANAQAAQFAYLTARAAEYDLLTPYPEIDEVFKARTANDLRVFLDDLKVWYQAADLPGQLNRYPYTLSLARDVMGLTDENLDPQGALSSEALEQLRDERFQEILQQYILEDTLQFEFGTSLDQRRTENQYLFSPNIWVNRIAGVSTPLSENQGISVNIVTGQSDDVGRPEVVLTHAGQASYRDAMGGIVHYDPGTAAPVGYVLPAGLNPPNTTVVLLPGINGSGGVANAGLVNRSVAASRWILRIPAASKGNLDYRQIQDIEIYLDSTGRALPGREQSAQTDAARLQAGLALAPFNTAERPTVEAPVVVSSAGSAPRATLNDTAVISGAYRGNVVISRPLPIALQVLGFDLFGPSTGSGQATLSGTVNTTYTAMYSGHIGLHGDVDGVSFTLASDLINTDVAGRPVQQRFTLTGQAEEGGQVLQGDYSGVITGLLPMPIVVEGRFSGSRLDQPTSGQDGEQLAVMVEPSAVLVGGTADVTAWHVGSEGWPMTSTQRITFATDLGTISPAAVDTVDGKAETTFIAGGTPGYATVVATNGPLTGTTLVEVTSWDRYRHLYLPVVFKGD